MRRVVKGALAIAGVLTAALALLVVGLLVLGNGHFTFRPPIEQRAAFDCSGCATYPPALSARGHSLAQADGSVVTLRGVMVPELARLYDEGRLNADLFRSIANTGANVVRLPVDPETRRTDGEYLARYLDPAVRWAGEAGLYAIVDLHMIGNVETGAGQAMPDAPARPLAEEVWRAVATYFRDAPHTLFEVFNEPQGIPAAVWQPAAADLVRIVREHGARQVVIVGGVDFASDASWVLDSPIVDDNLAYAVHIYPGTTVEWQRSFGEAAARYPVLMTEWGYMEENPSPTQSYLNGSAATYGEPLMAFLRERGVGWVACWWDDRWEPPMIAPGGTGWTGFGQFVLNQLGA
jgi:aryl-phospho-beta-D-glucosidase BglC (GH1 family)